MTCNGRALTFVVFLLQNVLPCFGGEVAVDGIWASWGAWSTCSVTCNLGAKTRTRTCTNPAPAFGGAECSGDAVDGNWAPWDPWSTCSVTCATGTQTRTRTCTNPAPAGDGDDCSGDSQGTQNCNTQTCPIDGNWAPWDPWSTCSVTCATGTQTRTRTCTNPAPAGDGDDCSGDSQGTQNCNTQTCPIDGDWTLWGSWSACGVTCSDTPVTRSRERSCANPEPQYNGTDCNGNTAEAETCDLNPCPVDGNWGAWQDLNGCSVTCGTGIRRWFRVCDSPVPARMGEQCQGEQLAEESCSGSQVSCPANNNNRRFLNALFLLGMVLTVTGMYGAGMPYTDYDVGSGGYGYGGWGFGFGGRSGGSNMSNGFGGIFKLVIYVMVFVMIINLLGSSLDGLGDGGG